MAEMTVEQVKEVAHDVLKRVSYGERLSSTPERWWDWMNPYVIRFEGEKPLPVDVCDFLKSRRLLRRARAGYLELAQRGMAQIRKWKEENNGS